MKALVVPVFKSGEIIGYMSVRTEPTRQQIAEAETFYQQLKEGKASIPKTAFWKRLPLKVKLKGLVFLLLGMQIFGGIVYQFGSSLGLRKLGQDGL